MQMSALGETKNVLVRPTMEHTFVNCQVVLRGVSRYLRQVDKLDESDCDALSLVLHMVGNAMEVFRKEDVSKERL